MSRQVEELFRFSLPVTYKVHTSLPITFPTKRYRENSQKLSDLIVIRAYHQLNVIFGELFFWG